MSSEAQARLMLFVWAGVVFVFFSLEHGSRMEYYAFGAWPAVAVLLGLGLASAEEAGSRWLKWMQGALALIGLAAAGVLGFFIYASLGIRSTGDISQHLETQSMDAYRLSMAHFLDLTPAAFADLRWQAAAAMIVFAVGFGGAWIYVCAASILPRRLL